MIVHRFLAWIETASAERRAEGVSALARSFLYADLTADDRGEAVLALTAVLDDASPVVRRALAEALASATAAPHHLVAALAADQSDIASVVLSRSPVLSDAELIDSAAVSSVIVQSAIASRPRLSAPVAAALAEVGGLASLVVLARNRGADIPEFSLARMVERLGADAQLREALLARPGLSLAMRHRLMVETANVLAQFVVARGWIGEERARRLSSDARERATIDLADQGGHAGARQLVTHLRVTGALTAGVLLRAILSANRGMFEAAVIELSGLAPIRVAGMIREFHGQGFAALYKRAGLPAALLPVFRAALTAADALSPGRSVRNGGRLSLTLVEKALDACRALDGRNQPKLVALLRRFQVEAAREEARQVALDAMCTRRLEEALELRSLVLEAVTDVVEPMPWSAPSALAAAAPLRFAA